jgi:hypothetical protein
MLLEFVRGSRTFNERQTAFVEERNRTRRGCTSSLLYTLRDPVDEEVEQ